MVLKDILGIWGAVLSTALGIIKIYEIKKTSYKRIRIDSHSNDYEKVNTFTVVNLSSTPINISYYDIYYAKWKFSRDKIFINTELYGDTTNIEIMAYRRCDLSFRESKYFLPYADRYKEKKLFITLYISGRKSITRKVRLS